MNQFPRRRKRILASFVMGLYLVSAAIGVIRGWGFYSPLLDNLLPVIRPIGCGEESRLSFLWPTAYWSTAGITGDTDDVFNESPFHITINPNENTLTLYLAREKLKTYPVAVGKPRTPSPPGEWTIIYKSANWGGGFGPRWLGLNVPWGIYGIHGTNKPYSIGSDASAGCIRMFNSDVKELFDMVPAGTPVDIVGALPDVPMRAELSSGAVGRDVQQLQQRLRTVGLPAGRLDGRYGAQTERAVRELELFYGFPVDGVADGNVMKLLDIR